MAYKDLREFIAKLEKEVDLVNIQKEVDWNLEVGAIIRRTCELGAPAPFFHKIKDYSPQYRILGAPQAARKRVALALGMDSNTSQQELIEEFLERKKNPIKPIVLNQGPCQENVLLGEEIDLFKLPAPVIHEGDGGRYLCTWHVSISKDPDSDWVNWGMYRGMIHDSNALAGGFGPETHIGMMFYQKYEPRNQPMPYAIAIGCEPVLEFCATTHFPVGVSEVDMAGAMRGELVELVKGKTIDLYVPATAEIVLEGEILPGIRKEEGPFGEFPGYLRSVKVLRPIFRVKAITFRNDPILTVSCMGVPIDDCHAPMSITGSAEVLDEMRSKGLPVVAAAVYPECSIMLTVISTKVTQANIASKIADTFWASRGGNTSSHLIIVEDDVDPFDKDRVLHALATKCHPARGIVKREQTTAMSLTPFLSVEEKLNQIGAKAYYDCTWPAYWDKSVVPKRASFDSVYPKEIQERVVKNWESYGYKL